MKKILSLLLALCMAMCVCGCGSDAPQQTGGANPGADSPAAAEPGTADGFVFSAKGCEIAMKAPAEPIVAALGEPKSYTEEPSCAFDGLDKTYYYGSFYMTTYPEDGKDFIYSLWFADDSVSTAEGVCIGMAQADVEKAYGADSFNGSNAYILTQGETRLTIILTENAVSSILYEAVFS